MKKSVFIIVVFTLFTGFYSCNAQKGEPVVQTSIVRIDQMPDIPQPLNIIDWRMKTMQFDSIIFNLNNKDSYGSLIWLDSSRRNINQVTFGLYTVLGDVRQGPKKNNGEFHGLTMDRY